MLLFRDTIVACSDSKISLLDLADEIFNYAREQEEQVITVHVNLSDDISLSTFEKTWDQVCKVHTERLEGVDPFEKGQVKDKEISEQKKLKWDGYLAVTIK